MSTDKRARQKANRANRVAEAEAMARRARIRSRIFVYSGLAVLVIGAVVIVSLLRSEDEPESIFDDFDPGDFAIDPDDLASEPSEPTEPTDTTDPSPTTTLAPYGQGECPATDGSSPRQIDFTDRQPLCIDPSASYTAVIDTSEGEITVELDTVNTPITTNNFITLARFGYYDGTTLFRTDPGIDIIQGGSPHSESPDDQGPGYSLPDEPAFGSEGDGLAGTYSYEPGQLVMARRGTPDGGSAQFFFTTGPLAANLDATGNFDGTGTYVIFGNTDDDGLTVLQAVMGLHEDDPTSPLGGGPSRTVTINSVTILET